MAVKLRLLAGNRAPSNGPSAYPGFPVPHRGGLRGSRGREQADHIPVPAGAEHEQALLMARLQDTLGRLRSGCRPSAPTSSRAIMVPRPRTCRRPAPATKREELDTGDVVFGDQDWRSLALSGTPQEKKRRLIEHYLLALRQANFAYALVFEMFDEGGHELLIVYAASSLSGLEKMKESVWAVDPAYRVANRRDRCPLCLLTALLDVRSFFSEPMGGAKGGVDHDGDIQKSRSPREPVAAPQTGCVRGGNISDISPVGHNLFATGAIICR